MILKDIYLSDSGIAKDFVDRNIPQYSHNNIQIKVYIPVEFFEDLTNYSVELSAMRMIDHESLPTLVLFSDNAKTLDGVDYIGFSAVLDIKFTEYISQIRFTPYIKVINTIDNNGVEDVIVSVQKTFTYVALNVIKSIADTFDITMEEASVVSQLASAINNKKITYTNEYNNYTESALINSLINAYDPTYYNGYIVVASHQNKNKVFYIDDSQWTLMDNETAKFYRITKIDEDTFVKTPLTYDKSEIDGTFATFGDITEMQNTLEQMIRDGEFGLYPMDEIDILDVLAH